MKNEVSKVENEAGDKEQGYNGYTNYETWLVCLNIDNDQGLHDEIQQFAVEQSKTKDKYEVGEEIQEYLAGMCHIKEYNIYKIKDVWTQRDWQEINWTEVAETRLEE